MTPNPLRAAHIGTFDPPAAALVPRTRRDPRMTEAHSSGARPGAARLAWRFARALALSLACLLPAGAAPAQDAAPKVHPWKLAHARRISESGLERRKALERRKKALRWTRRELRRLRLASARARGERARPALPEDRVGPPGDATPLETPAQRFGSRAFTTPPNVIVNSRAGDVSDAGQSETTVAAWGDIVVAAWNDGQGFVSPDDTQGWAVSSDGGQTWVDEGVFPRPAGVLNFQWTSDPVLAVNDRTGAFYFAALCEFTVSGQFRSGTAVVKGRWNGSTIAWGNPSIARDVSFTNDFVDKEWIVADSLSGRVYLSYTRFPAGLSRIEFQWADSNATAWSVPAPISLDNAVENGYVQGSRPAVDGDGRVYVVYEQIGQSFSDFYRVARSLDGGVTFSPPVTAESLYTNFGTGGPGFNRDIGIQFCGIAVDRSHGPDRGRVYLSWAESINWLDEAFDLGGAGDRSEVEPNGTSASATPVTLGQTVRGNVSGGTDADFFALPLTQGQHIVIAADSSGAGAGAPLSLRLVAGDGITRLTFTRFDEGVNPGFPAGWMFTAPVTGTYHIRVGSLAGSIGRYRLRTGEVHRDDGERGRDQRDIFVGSSPDGVTWGDPVRVNEDPVGFDGNMPEVMVGPDGGVYCAWFDYRDSAPAKNGGEASVYLARSGDGGLTWTTLGALADSLSDWTLAATNIEPNQGDYMALTSSTSYVWGVWSDARRGDPDVFAARTPLIPLGVQVAFQDVRIGNELISVDWTADPADTLTMRLYRSTDGGPFAFLEVVQFDAGGRLTYTDTTVTGGHGYSYRLGRFTSGVELFFGQVSVFLPSSFPLSLARPRPNPVTGASFGVSFSLATNEPAELVLYDIAGREVFRRTVNLGMGPHTLTLPVASGLRSGMYVLTLRQGGRDSSTRLALVR